MVRCPLDTCRYNHDGTCTKDDVVLEIADVDEHMTCACYVEKLNKERVWLGLDLSMSDDNTAVAMVMKYEGEVYGEEENANVK